MKMRPLADASASPLNACLALALLVLLFLFPLPLLVPAPSAAAAACSFLSVSHASRIAETSGFLARLAALADAWSSASSRSMVVVD